jgi:hypothetical protein
VRLTITRMQGPALLHGCQRRPRTCHTVRRIRWRVHQGLNTLRFQSLLRESLRPGRYRLDINSPTGTAHASVTFRVLPAPGRPPAR